MLAFMNDRSSTSRSPDLSRSSPQGRSRTPSARPTGSGPSQCSPSHVELVLHADAHVTSCAENEALMMSSHGSRPARPPALSPGPHAFSVIPPHSAISEQYNPYSPSQDVLALQLLLNQRPISHRSDPSSNPGHKISSTALESHSLSSSSTRYAAINSPSPRPRTSNPVFNNITDLAAHYGIPQFLPTAPRTTPRRTEPEEQASSHQTEHFLSSPDFSNLCTNYLTMLSQKPGDNGANDVPSADIVPESATRDVTDADAIKSLMDVLNATPELQMSNDLNEYLTSPLIDSPLDDELLTTPAVGSDMHADILTSPLMGDFVGDSFGEFPSLFEGFNEPIYQAPKPPQHNGPLLTPYPPHLDDMYTISPETPLIDSPGVSPLHRPIAPLPSELRKSNVTGTRKNITPESLVPIDAPTQLRKYLTPSATSRKQLPATWRRKRVRTADAEEEDELGEEPTPTVTEQEQIEAKRRQNTIAARRSRKRKLEYQRELEGNLEAYKRESEIWKQRAMTYQALLRSHHIECPEFPDS